MTLDTVKDFLKPNKFKIITSLILFGLGISSFFFPSIDELRMFMIIIFLLPALLFPTSFHSPIPINYTFFLFFLYLVYGFIFSYILSAIVYDLYSIFTRRKMKKI